MVLSSSSSFQQKMRRKIWCRWVTARLLKKIVMVV